MARTTNWTQKDVEEQGLSMYEWSLEFGKDLASWVLDFDSVFGEPIDEEDDLPNSLWQQICDNCNARCDAGRSFKEIKLDGEVSIVIYGVYGYADVEKVRRILQEHFQVRSLGVDGDEETCILTTGKGAA